MREIVTRTQMDHLFVWLAVLLPLAGLLVGLLRRRSGRSAGRSMAQGFLFGLVGPANLLLWVCYGAITDRMGLDRVATLLTNLALFVALGAGVGLSAAYFARRPDTPEPAAVNQIESVGEPKAHQSDSEPAVQ